MDNRIVIIESELNSLHTSVNILQSTNKHLTTILKELLSLAKKYVPKDELAQIVSKIGTIEKTT